MFEERLKRVAEAAGGVLGVSLVSRDGIPVESYQTDERLDLEALAAELLTQVKTASRDQQELAMGSVRQFSVTTDHYNLILGALSQGYYLLLVQEGTASFGRARFELRRARLAFEEDLA